MRESMEWRPVYTSVDIKDATIKVNGLEIKVGQGNLTYTEHRTINYILDRGELDDVKKGDDVPMDVKIDCVWQYLQSTTSANADVEAAIKGTAGTTSSDTTPCRPFACDIKVELDPACGKKETILLADFRWETFDHDLRAGTLSVSGKCNVTEATKAYSY